MSYGTIKNSEGVDLSADGLKQIQVGQCVTGNIIESLDFAEDQNGGKSTNRAVLVFKQSNGSKFTHSFFNNDAEWAKDQVKKEMLHICTKIVTKEEYEAAISGVNSFYDFIEAVKTKVIPKAEGKSFSLKITFKKSGNGKFYPNFPKYPSFMELDGTTPSTLTTNPLYDIYIQPAPTVMADSSAMSVSDIF